MINQLKTIITQLKVQPNPQQLLCQTRAQQFTPKRNMGFLNRLGDQEYQTFLTQNCSRNKNLEKLKNIYLYKNQNYLLRHGLFHFQLVLKALLFSILNINLHFQLLLNIFEKKFSIFELIKIINILISFFLYHLLVYFIYLYTNNIII